MTTRRALPSSPRDYAARATKRPPANGKPATLARAPAAPKAPPELPGGPRYACGGTRYWLTPGNAYECRTCHPEPARLRREWLQRDITPQAQMFDRVGGISDERAT